MPPTTITRGNTTHEETAGNVTGCGIPIGMPSAGWRRTGIINVNCMSCLRVRAEADRFLKGMR